MMIIINSRSNTLPLTTLLVVVTLFVFQKGVDAFAPIQSWHHETHKVTSRVSAQLLSTGDNDNERSIERVRAAAFQAPSQSNGNPENPLAVLTQVADSLRVASMAGVDVVLFPELYLSGAQRALDRESYELNIVGNVCGELNVACVMGYAESIHKSELKTSDDPDDKKGAYNSIAAFHADGSRAGNYRCVSVSETGDEFREGQSFVESTPILLQLPNRGDSCEREIKVGMICGNDILRPEICRHLARSGSQAIFASTSMKSNDNDSRTVKCVIPTRAIENEIPFLYANFVGQSTIETGDSQTLDFIGSSGIVAADGSYLVCGPEEEDGDMPCDEGYLLPCEDGMLYAADINITGSDSSSAQQSIGQWDLNPRLPDGFGKSDEKVQRKDIPHSLSHNGFGRENGRQGKKAKR